MALMAPQPFSCYIPSFGKVQVKYSVPVAKSPGGIPFMLKLKDPMAHIESMNENPKYATNIKDNNNSSSFHNDCFNVIIPEQEKYFSLLKYRCKNDLRPVPIVSCVCMCIVLDRNHPTDADIIYFSEYKPKSKQTVPFVVSLCRSAPIRTTNQN